MVKVFLSFIPPPSHRNFVSDKNHKNFKNGNMEIDLANVITAIGGLIGAVGGVYSIWTKFNQDAKNKMTDLKIEQFRKEEERRGEQRSKDAASARWELWHRLHTCRAARV